MNASSSKKGVVFLALIFVVIVAAIVFIVVSLNSDPATDNLKENEIVTVLLVLNDGNNNALATDVLLYYPKSQKGALFNISGNIGDIYEGLSGGNERGRTDRIDAVYRELGIDAYNKEVGKLLGLTIPFNIEIGLNDFGLLTDLLGGMKLFVDAPVDMKMEKNGNPVSVSEDGSSKTSADGEEYIRWLLPAGSVTLDGDKIQTYIQYRLPGEEDSDVETRRQMVMVSMLSALHEKRDVLLEKRNFQLYAGKFKANVSDKILHKLFEYISSMDAETDSLSPQGVQGSLRKLASENITLLFPLFEGQLIKDIVRAKKENLINEGSSTYRYVLEVKNGTEVQGLANNASILLRGLGNYDVLPASDADSNDYEHTVIINHMQTKDPDALKVLANFISCKNIEHNPSSGLADGSNVDFTVILGTDWDGRYVRGGYVNPANEEAENQEGVSPAPASE